MKDSELKIKLKNHVLYSRACKREILKKIKLHYGDDECEKIWESVQNQYLTYLKSWDKDLGGKKNFHNSKGGNYDCFALMCYYTVCKNVTSLRAIEEMEENLFLPSFKILSKFINYNRPIYKKVMYKAFKKAKKRCDKWNDYKMILDPYHKDKSIHYEFTTCPVAEFAKKYSLEEIMPALCNVDYVAMELIRAKLIRKETLVYSNKCDYLICGDEDEYVKLHPEYVDEKGNRRNK